MEAKPFDPEVAPATYGDAAKVYALIMTELDKMIEDSKDDAGVAVAYYYDGGDISPHDDLGPFMSWLFERFPGFANCCDEATNQGQQKEFLFSEKAQDGDLWRLTIRLPKWHSLLELRYDRGDLEDVAPFLLLRDVDGEIDWERSNDEGRHPSNFRAVGRHLKAVK